MKTFVLTIISIFTFSLLNAQIADLTGKQFHQMDEMPDSDTYLKFVSSTKATYIMTGTLPISHQSYRDECPCTVTITGSKVSIRCICSDKEVYPDPIEDSFTYDSKTQTLTSTRFRSLDGEYWVWKLN